MKRVLIAQPTTGSVVSGTVGYMMALVNRFTQEGVHWDYRSLSLSDIALSRNMFASYVIAQNDFTHLLFIDSDMGFMPDTIMGMLELDEMVVAAACPKRFLDWDHFRQTVEAECDNRPRQERRQTAQLIDIALRYNVDLTRFDGSPWTAKRAGNFMTVPAVGTGIMLINRDVFETMLAHDVAVPRPGYKDLTMLEGAPLCDFFSPIETPDGALIESEDISFCKRWVEDCGGEIWVDIVSRIMHFGMRGHSGRYLPHALVNFPEIKE